MEFEQLDKDRDGGSEINSVIVEYGPEDVNKD